MQLKIKNREYELRFGIGFIRELDMKHPLVQSGIRFGMGLESSLPMLYSGNIATLADIIHSATVTEKKRPSQGEVDSYIEEIEDIGALLQEVMDELKKNNATKAKAVAVEKSLGLMK